MALFKKDHTTVFTTNTPLCTLYITANLSASSAAVFLDISFTPLLSVVTIN